MIFGLMFKLCERPKLTFGVFALVVLSYIFGKYDGAVRIRKYECEQIMRDNFTAFEGHR